MVSLYNVIYQLGVVVELIHIAIYHGLFRVRKANSEIPPWFVSGS